MANEQKNKKALLVDDDDFLLDMYSKKFEEDEFEVIIASDGETALEKLRSEEFDVLIVDLVMPEVDGFEVLHTLNEEGLNKNMKVIVLSNQGSTEDINKAKEEGIDGYIVKASAVPSEVLEKVREIVNQ